MSDNKRLSGAKLDQLIESELLAMVREGLETSPIKAATLHRRLVTKGYVSGSLSTLSTAKRKTLIKEHQRRQLNQMNLEHDELDLLVEGRKANQTYLKMAKRMKHQRDEMKTELDLNTFALLDIINTIEVSTSIKVEDLLSEHLIRERAKANK